jgi:hypothetical protein
MQIRKRGSNFQLLRRKKDESGQGYVHRTIGAFPATCRSIEEIDQEVLAKFKLGKREYLQLEEYLERRREQLNDKLKKRELAEVPKTLLDIGKQIKGNFRENYDVDEVLHAYKAITQALCEHGYAPELVRVTLTAAANTIPDFELEQDGAAQMMSAWEKLRKPLEEHGYTPKWFTAYKKLKK